MGKLRKTLWYLFYIGGTYITFMNILRSYLKFAEFRSVRNVQHTTVAHKNFPKILLCPNSMHSKHKGNYFFRKIYD